MDTKGVLRFMIVVVLMTTALQATQYCPSPQCNAIHCPQIPCYHGECAVNGSCRCNACWEGTSCNLTTNPTAPVFTTTRYDVYASTPLSPTTPVVKVTAKDDDDTTCAKGDHNDCPCGKIIYTIEKGNGDGVFKIDPTNGEIFFIGDASKRSVNRRHLVVAAQNPSDASTRDAALAVVSITLSRHARRLYDIITKPEPKDAFEEKGLVVQSVVDARDQRLAMEKVDLAYLAANSMSLKSTAFFFEKTSPNPDVPQLSLGGKVHFRLAIQFPIGTDNMLVELLGALNDSVVVGLENVVIKHIGSSLVLKNNTVAVLLDHGDITTGRGGFDRAVLEFGNTTNIGNAKNAVDEMIIIEWDAVLIECSDTAILSNPQCTDCTSPEYWLSAGVEFNNESCIWIGSLAFSINTNEVSEDDGTKGSKRPLKGMLKSLY